jgi:hypothetical protein
VPLLWSRRPASELSRRRVAVHYYLDLFMILYVNVVYCFCPPLLPVVVVGSLVGWWTVFRPKQFHGLLHRLKEPARLEQKFRLSLPVVATGGLIASGTVNCEERQLL